MVTGMKLANLIKILKSANKITDIAAYTDEIIDLIPKVQIMIGFDQRNSAHQYNLWEHCLHTVVELPKDIKDDMVYLAALLHDIGKPGCEVYDTKDGKVNIHYYGHPLRSMEVVRDEIIPAINKERDVLGRDDIRRLLYYVEHHDDRMSLRIKHLRQHLNLGASIEEFQNLMKLEVADAKAHILLPIIQERIDICGQLAGEYSIELYEKIKAGI